MDDRRLVALQGQYRTGRRNMRIGAYLAPLPLLLLSLLSHERAFVSTILGFCFFASFSLLLAARLFGEIERVVTMELDFRKGNKDR